MIIPVFNVAPFLHEALDSVVHQSYSNLEIIIVDDGSTDGSGKTCDEYKHDPRVHVIHQNNQGLSSARNTGLDLATGDYIVFLDSDDAFKPDMIQHMVKEIIDSSADMVVCSHNLFWTEGRLDQARSNKEGFHYAHDEVISSLEAQRRLLSGSFSCQVWNKLYKRELWNNIRFPDGHVYEDIRTIFEILERCKTVRVISDSLVLHRKRKGSITTTESDKNILDKVLSFSSVEDYIEAHIPSVFSFNDLEKVRERHACSVTNLYVKSRKQSNIAELLCAEADQRWKKLKHLTIRSNLYRFMFYSDPNLIGKAIVIKMMVKRICGKRY